MSVCLYKQRDFKNIMLPAGGQNHTSSHPGIQAKQKQELKRVSSPWECIRVSESLNFHWFHVSLSPAPLTFLFFNCVEIAVQKKFIKEGNNQIGSISKKHYFFQLSYILQVTSMGYRVPDT